MEKILILESRKKYHKMLSDKKVLTISADGIASNADSGNIPSIEISKIIAKHTVPGKRSSFQPVEIRYMATLLLRTILTEIL